MTDEPGIIYLIHFAEPYQHARHYLGWTSDLDSRLEQHRNGQGARLMAVIKKAGIGWELARTWTGTRTRERSLKARGHGRMCPICTPKTRRVPTN
jgi:predicted GIY-YIG superfamily endonuclease